MRRRLEPEGELGGHGAGRRTARQPGTERGEEVPAGGAPRRVPGAARRLASGRVRQSLRSTSTVALILLAALVVYLWPASLGGRASIVFVDGTSMLPTLTTDDVVLAREQVQYAVGDLVVFHIPDPELAAQVNDRLVIHRIVGGSEATGWVTRGDNRDYVDPWFLDDGDIIGRAERKAAVGPAALTGLQLILSPAVWALVAGVITFAVTWRVLGERDRARQAA